MIHPVDNTLKNRKDCRGFLDNPRLVLVVKRPIETVEIEIQTHGLFSIYFLSCAVAQRVIIRCTRYRTVSSGYYTATVGEYNLQS